MYYLTHFPAILSCKLDLLKNKVQNRIMIQNPQKVRYFQSGNCSRKLSSNPLQKMCQNAELVLRLRVIVIRDFIQIFSKGEMLLNFDYKSFTVFTKKQ